MVSVNNFRTYFFSLGELDVSFLNLLSTAINNFIKPKVDFFSKLITWHSPLACRILPGKDDFMN